MSSFYCCKPTKAFSPREDSWDQQVQIFHSKIDKYVKLNPGINKNIYLSRMVSWQGQHHFRSTVKGTLPKLTWFLPFLGPLMAIIVLLFKHLFNIKFVSLCLQDTKLEVRLLMVQGVQPIPVAGPGPDRSLEQSLRDFYTSRIS